MTDSGNGPCWIKDSTFQNFKLDAGSASIVQLSGSPAFLRGLAFDSCNAAVAVTQALIEVDANVTDFSVTDCFGLPASGSTFNYGVLVAAGTSDRYVITNNEFSAAATAKVLDGGTGTNKNVANNPT